MAQKILLKRGVKANLPGSADAAEPLLTTDTHELYVGTGAGVSPLKVDYANVLNPPVAAAVSSVNTKTGAVSLDTETHRPVLPRQKSRGLRRILSRNRLSLARQPQFLPNRRISASRS